MKKRSVRNALNGGFDRPRAFLLRDGDCQSSFSSGSCLHYLWTASLRAEQVLEHSTTLAWDRYEYRRRTLSGTSMTVDLVLQLDTYVRIVVAELDDKLPKPNHVVSDYLNSRSTRDLAGQRNIDGVRNGIRKAHNSELTTGRNAQTYFK